MWVFAYGSLMWRPGFQFEEQCTAILYGMHRSLCILSHVHRGTPDQPGLVLGLDQGGSCKGMAFRVGNKQWPETLSYLRAREQVTMVYKETSRLIHLNDGKHVKALAYIADRTHVQFAGLMDRKTQATLICKAKGLSGHNIEYVQNTVSHLDMLGIYDKSLYEVATLLNQ